MGDLVDERDLSKRWGVTHDCARCSYVPEGWVPLLDRLMQALAEIPDWDPSHAWQIKSKFGGLRFYYGLPAHASADMKTRVKATIDRFEGEAANTCARCGNTDAVKIEPDQVGWVRTECGACRQPR